MPNTQIATDSQPRRTFRYPSIPFYLKAILLTCVSTAAYVMLRGSRLREEVSSARGPNADTFSIKLADIPAITEPATFFAPPTVSSFAAPISSMTDFTHLETASPLVSSQLGNAEEQEHDKTSAAVQRHLLQASTPVASESVVVANPIPDQFAQIGERYTYDVSKVFAGDYLSIQASGLPSWLNLEYKKLSAYPAGGGAAQRIAVSGNTVFVANGKAGIQILDVSNLRFPQLLSTYSFGNSLTLDVAISENILFVANHNAGIKILNVSNLRSPQLLNTYPAGSNGLSYGVAVSDNTLFVANHNAGLLILNVSNLRSPQLLSTYPAGNGSTFGVTVSGNILFMADYNAGLLILNVSNPSYPQLLSKYPSTTTLKVTVSDNTVFISKSNAFLILNVTDLKNPKFLSVIYPANGGRAYGVAVLDKILFAANYNGGLQIFNVSNLNKPQVLGFYLTGNGYANGVVVSGNRVFVAYDAGGLHIFDLSSARLSGIPLATEVKVGQKWMIDVVAQNLDISPTICTFQLTGGYLPQLVQNTLTDKSILPGEPFLISIKSQQLFSAPATSFLRFSFHQVSNKVLPAWLALEVYPISLSTYPTEQTGSVWNVVVLDNTVFLGSDKGLFILDVSDLKFPQLLSKYSKSGSSTRGVTVLNNTLFAANWNAGMSILNVSDPRDPKLLGNYLAGVSYAWGVAISSSGNIAFVVNHGNGNSYNGSLQILDTSNFTSPRLLYTYLTGSRMVWGVVVADNTVFIASDFKGVIILNVSNPRSPQLLNNYLLNGSYAYDVAISNSILFVAGYYVGLLVLNVSNPKRPQLLSTYPPGSGLSCGVAVLGNIVFVANWNPGLLILDVSNLTQPQLVGTYPAGNGFSRGVAVSDNAVFMANANGGLQILDIRNWELKITANPTITDVGNYYLTLIATDEIGASVSIPFTIRVEGAPQVKSPIAQPYAEIGQLFSFNIPLDTFTDPNLDPLVFDLSCVDQTELPNWLKFNELSVTLFGIPTVQDRGRVHLRLTAKDPRGETAYTDFSLTVVNAPKAILGQPLSLIQKRFFNYTLQLETIFDGYDQSLSYVIERGIDSAVLPEWLNYTIVDTVLMLSGIPTTTGTVTLSVLAQTPLNYTASTTFVLSISPNFPPQVKQAISAQTATVGVTLDFVFPENIFEDGNGDRLTYTAALAGGESLPNWLQFVQSETGSWHFKGKPDGWDTNAFSARTMTIQIIAQDTQGASATTFFNLSVNGTSTLGVLIKVATPILSVLGLFRKRGSILNRLCYKRYQKPPHTLQAGQSFCLPLVTSKESIDSIEVKRRHIPPKGCARFTDCQRFFKPPIHYLQLPYDTLPEGLPLPKWMEYKKSKNTLEGILPLDVDYRELMVRVKNRNGIVQEQFILKLEGTALDQEENESSVLARSNPSPKNTKKAVELDDLEGASGGAYSRLQG